MGKRQSDLDPRLSEDATCTQDSYHYCSSSSLKLASRTWNGQQCLLEITFMITSILSLIEVKILFQEIVVGLMFPIPSDRIWVILQQTIAAVEEPWWQTLADPCKTFSCRDGLPSPALTHSWCFDFLATNRLPVPKSLASSKPPSVLHDGEISFAAHWTNTFLVSLTDHFSSFSFG